MMGAHHESRATASSSGKRSSERHDRLRQGGSAVKFRDLARSGCGGNRNIPWPDRGMIFGMAGIWLRRTDLFRPGAAMTQRRTQNYE